MYLVLLAISRLMVRRQLMVGTAYDLRRPLCPKCVAQQWLSAITCKPSDDCEDILARDHGMMDAG